MVSNKIGIIYSTASKMIRRIIVPDDDNELNDASRIGDGESILIVDRSTINGHKDVESAVEVHTGVKPANITCAVVSNGMVVSLIKADPDIDTHPIGKLVAAPVEIDISCSYDEKTGKFLIPERIIPSGKDREGNDIPEQLIPAKNVDAVVGVKK